MTVRELYRTLGALLDVHGDCDVLATATDGSGFLAHVLDVVPDSTDGSADFPVTLLRLETDYADLGISARFARRAERGRECDKALADVRRYHTLAEVAQEERDGLLTLLREVAPSTCDNLHHAKKDRHEIGEPCPILTRLAAALEVDEE